MHDPAFVKALFSYGLIKSSRFSTIFKRIAPSFCCSLQRTKRSGLEKAPERRPRCLIRFFCDLTYITSFARFQASRRVRATQVSSGRLPLYFKSKPLRRICGPLTG